ncbi:hypothetical protein RVR_6952 [Actinacidiphila reveromycinica]|uniref:DUF1990 domain-containing protein n=1 Tax=Actinacidiphila reveromycinica TaxID=659352 RepID=A0A7U3UWI3_9ACTN|nr:DUF1990 domain-containing protein [Streptomyces sp. SN-593]BBB00062.1 hypothetical protein RVR_6952 [Streptomyces sp. SN-593]
MGRLTYARVGMTRDGGSTPPDGFRSLTVRTRLGVGDGVYEAAARALFGWEMHRATPLVTVPAGTPDAAPGVRVEVRLGPLRAPCEVVWTLGEEHRTGFAYGTLPGHPECGEESFVVHRLPDGTVDLTVHASSRPAAWYLRAAGPLGRLAQRVAAGGYGRALRRACRAAGSSPS